MAVYTGVTVNYYGKRYGNWRFSWSYIIGWVAMVLTFFSGTQAVITAVHHLLLLYSVFCTLLFNIFNIQNHIIHIIFVYFQVYSTCVLTGCMSAQEVQTHIRELKYPHWLFQ